MPRCFPPVCDTVVTLRALRDGSALLICHASPVRDARLRSVSGNTRPHVVAPGLWPSLRSIRAAHGGSALLICHASPVRDARLRSVSGKTRPHVVGPRLLPSLRSIRAAHDGSALLTCHHLPLHSRRPPRCRRRSARRQSPRRPCQGRGRHSGRPAGHTASR